MGACASVFPKAMKGDAGEALPPQPPKVEAEGEENKVEGGEGKNKEGDESHSLGTLLNESEKTKEMAETEKATVTETAPSTTVKSEEKESESVVSVSDEKAAAYVAPIAHVTNGDQETEANVEKN
ncbi:Beta-defensin 107A like [Actinidia chinensis var. chinensis]|uniref:Beta-defensin 107A like n=1 Tax=Actinidia chinensis var. chinensis TaxID=1590841 RepID=A0A2R6Q6F9_ACTCC|nr:Beta-defensin 107A like [Actinidia chinensis var. chinensis]